MVTKNKKMKKNIVTSILGLFVGVLLGVFFVNATQSFSLAETSFDFTPDIGEVVTGTFTITNTGNESITLGITPNNLQNRSDEIKLSVSETSIVIAEGSSHDVTFTFTAGSVLRVFSGDVQISNVATQTIKIVDISATITLPTVNGQSIVLKDERSDTILSSLGMDVELQDDTESLKLSIVNNGNVNISNISMELSDEFDGDDDSFDSSEFTYDFGSEEVDGDDVAVLDKVKNDPVVLNPGDSYNFKLVLDVPSVEIDTYEGELTITYSANGIIVDKKYDIFIIITSDEDLLYIARSDKDVRAGVIDVFVEPGEKVDDVKFLVVNDGGDEYNVIPKLKDPLEEEDSSATIAKSAVSFSPYPIEVDKSDDQEVRMTIEVPENQATGTYTTEIELYNSNGEKSGDSISLRLHVTGDIYIQSVTCNGKEDCEAVELSPGDELDVEVIVKNQGSKTYRNVKVTGTLLDVDTGDSDLEGDDGSSFLLSSGATKTEKIKFTIPDDAKDSQPTLEIQVSYDTINSFSQLETVNIVRPDKKVVITSYAINPSVAKCVDGISGYIRAENLGKYDSDVEYSVEISNTNIKKSSGIMDLPVDYDDQYNFALDISSLDPGTYTVVQKVSYNGLVSKKESSLKILECTQGTIPGIDIKPINDTDVGGNQSGLNESSNSADTIHLFGSDIEKTTVYLGSGVALVFVFIIVGLFLL